jgi:hypothetical protein
MKTQEVSKGLYEIAIKDKTKPFTNVTWERIKALVKSGVFPNKELLDRMWEQDTVLASEIEKLIVMNRRNKKAVQ